VLLDDEPRIGDDLLDEVSDGNDAKARHTGSLG